ncbi:hypothetical protein [Kutzneria sp. NPDC052558]
MPVLDEFDTAAAEARRVARAPTPDQLGAASQCAGHPRPPTRESARHSRP